MKIQISIRRFLVLRINSKNIFRHVQQEFIQLVLFYHHVWVFPSHLCYLLVCIIFHLISEITLMFLATPPNAMLFAGGNVRIIDMIKVGIIMKLIGMAVILFASMFLISPIFHIHSIMPLLNDTSFLNSSIGR